MQRGGVQCQRAVHCGLWEAQILEIEITHCCVRRFLGVLHKMSLCFLMTIGMNMTGQVQSLISTPPPPRARAAPSFCPPGGPWFNLFNLGGKSEAEMKKLKLNEIKNGRLAMLAVFGYGAQVGPDSALK